MTKKDEKLGVSAVCDWERMMQDECGTIARCEELLREVAEAVSRFQKALPESAGVKQSIRARVRLAKGAQRIQRDVVSRT